MLADVQFNSEFLMKPKGQSVDVSRFERGNPVQPGEYTVDLYVNGNWVGHDLGAFRGTIRVVREQARGTPRRVSARR